MRQLDFRKIGEIFTLILFSIFVLSLPYSKSFVSIFGGLILISGLFFSFLNREIKSRLTGDPSFWLLISIFGVYLVGLLFTNDMKLGLGELNKELMLVTIVAGVYLSRRLSKKQFWFILTLFVFGVTVSTFISFVRMIFSNSFGVTNFRAVNYISHIPFSLQIAFSIFILIYSFFKENWILKFLKPSFRIVWIVWLLFFIVILKSFLGLIAFYFTVILLLYLISKRKYLPKYRKLVIVCALLFFLVPVLYLGVVIYKFYDVQYARADNLEQRTKSGNDYEFDFSNKLKENGYYVYWYICPKELEQAWNQRSSINYKGYDLKGYLLSGTLTRYMTSKGLRKDAEGVAMLTDRDVKNIESGVANYIYDTSIYAIYPRIYETIWEIDKYLLTGNPNNQSLSQRIEFSKAAFLIIKDHFWFGIGTGNYLAAYSETYKKMNSQLDEYNYGAVHNQYLSYWSKFGLIGFIYIAFVLICVLRKNKRYRNDLLMLFLVTLLIANFGDTIWETHIGLSYFAFFVSLFLWHSPDELIQ